MLETISEKWNDKSFFFFRTQSQSSFKVAMEEIKFTHMWGTYSSQSILSIRWRYTLPRWVNIAFYLCFSFMHMCLCMLSIMCPECSPAYLISASAVLQSAASQTHLHTRCPWFSASAKPHWPFSSQSFFASRLYLFYIPLFTPQNIEQHIGQSKTLYCFVAQSSKCIML